MEGSNSPGNSSTHSTSPIDTGSGRWTAEKEKILQMPYRYLLSRPGKEFRSQLIHAFNLWLQVPPESLEIISRVIGMLHTASLLIDDVEDSSLLRRGVPSAHQIFGVAQTINTSNYVYFVALNELCKLQHKDEAILVFSQELVNLHRGQGMDLFWRDTLTCPSEDDYLEMVGNKTGGLFRLAVRLMQAESDIDVDFVELVSMLGVLFQVLDDYLNLCSSKYTARKGHCEDLTEGKFSFPIIHAIKSKPDDLVIMSILRQRTNSEEVKQFAVEHMKKLGSFEYCVEFMDNLQARAYGEVDRLIMDLRSKYAAGDDMIDTAIPVPEAGETSTEWISKGAQAVRAIIDKMSYEEHL